MKNYFFIFIAFLLFQSCIDDEPMPSNTNTGNFESLTKIVDTKYCYLDYKKINWDSITDVYRVQVSDKSSEIEFFDLMAKMLGELKDGHVNLYSSFDRSRYWKWYTDYPSNFSSDIIFSPQYLSNNYKIAGGLRYGKIHNDSIGYIYYNSFSSGFSDSNISYVFRYFQDCKGLIIDVRDNGGGSLSYSEQLASYFFADEMVTGYISHKVGAGHSDFSKMMEIKTPAHKTLQWQRPVAVLTNRMSYSATNDFVNRMKQAPTAVIVGDKTGGGGGLPLSSELPNGWLLRFSASPMFDSNKLHTEWGIEPDVVDSITVENKKNGIDGIIERAVKVLKQAY